jgi:hypothetical protein
MKSFFYLLGFVFVNSCGAMESKSIDFRKSVMNLGDLDPNIQNSVRRKLSLNDEEDDGDDFFFKNIQYANGDPVKKNLKFSPLTSNQMEYYSENSSTSSDVPQPLYCFDKWNNNQCFEFYGTSFLWVEDPLMPLIEEFFNENSRWIYQINVLKHDFLYQNNENQWIYFSGDLKIKTKEILEKYVQLGRGKSVVQLHKELNHILKTTLSELVYNDQTYVDLRHSMGLFSLDQLKSKIIGIGSRNSQKITIESTENQSYYSKWKDLAGKLKKPPRFVLEKLIDAYIDHLTALGSLNPEKNSFEIARLLSNKNMLSWVKKNTQAIKNMGNFLFVVFQYIFDVYEMTVNQSNHNSCLLLIIEKSKEKNTSILELVFFENQPIHWKDSLFILNHHRCEKKFLALLNFFIKNYYKSHLIIKNFEQNITLGHSPNIKKYDYKSNIEITYCKSYEILNLR